ncbi:MAG: 16S rRNA (adenine(1518)-N(6)/adenine(1519)-N(6))-dimethyltransferase RsmA [Oligoflexales bacterium]
MKRLAQKKSLGQVFLSEDWPCRKMVEKLKDWNVVSVLEIGPGPGILTRHLLDQGIQVHAVEKDSRFADLLKEKKWDHCKVTEADILRFSLDDWLKENKGKRVAICGNIPYNISSPILQKILEAQLPAILMVQLEFAQRVVAPCNQKSYGSLSVYTQLRSRTQFEFHVPATVFRPQPKVESAVFSVQPGTKYSPEVLKNVEIVSRKSFMQRRKTLSNSLSSFLQQGELQVKDSPIDLKRRCETLSPDEFVILTEFLLSGTKPHNP